jgi:hypothetical protein
MHTFQIHKLDGRNGEWKPVDNDLSIIEAPHANAAVCAYLPSIRTQGRRPRNGEGVSAKGRRFRAVPLDA